MFNRRIAGALAALALCFACLPGKAALGADDYHSLLARVRNFDNTVDFMALRLAYAKTPDYNPYGRDNRKDGEMGKAIEEKKYEEAARIAQTVLEKNYVHIFAHLVMGVASRELGDRKKSEYHHFVTNGLIRSILGSGTGRNTEKAYRVINVDEEYMILDMFGLKGKKQSTLKVADQTYDKLETVDRKTGDTGEMFFNVTIPFGWLGRQFRKQGP